MASCARRQRELSRVEGPGRNRDSTERKTDFVKPRGQSQCHQIMDVVIPQERALRLLSPVPGFESAGMESGPYI
jgi:hypothetical protein